jgi:hypothetical protein
MTPIIAPTRKPITIERWKPAPLPPAPLEPPSWWLQYATSLERSGRLSSEAIGEIDRVAKRVATNLPSLDGPPVTCVGAVVGAVQSGKTGVMAGIAARALDRGFRVVVVLSGMREDLRSQTARRFKRELLDEGDLLYDWGDEGWARSDPRRYDHPLGKGRHGAMKEFWSPPFRVDVTADQAFQSSFVGALQRDVPVVVVVKKNRHVLERLHAAIQDARRSVATPWSMLVLDDECDEASPGNEAHERPTSESIKRLVVEAQAWSVAYVGVTATIAANILLDQSDPLFPRDFVEVARYASEEDTVLTFREPEPFRRYTGGYSYYRMIEECGGSNYLVQPIVGDLEQLGGDSNAPALRKALIDYFVSGAIRLRSTVAFDSLESHPSPHTMIAHTAGTIHSHRVLALEVIKATRAHSPKGGAIKLARDPSDRIETSDLERWLEAEASEWEESYRSFLEAQATLELAMPGAKRRSIDSWEEVKARLPAVFSNTKLRVVNSDETSDEPPLDFGGGSSEAIPYDCYSIIIGGNRLSRGLTIEGLAVTYFTRVSDKAISEDVAIQRARWFGYRGAHLEFCRLVLHPRTAQLYETLYLHEVDLRRQFVWISRQGRSPSDTAVRLLCLPNTRPTARIGRGTTVDVSFSGSRFFCPHTQPDSGELGLELATINELHAGVIWQQIRKGGSPVSSRDGAPKGYVLLGVTALDVANMLDGFQFAYHNPDPTTRVGAALRAYHRVHSNSRPECHQVPFAECPYALAAYLRYWEAAAHGREPTARSSNGISPWKRRVPPTFNVGFRFGKFPIEGDGPLEGAKLMDRAINGNGDVLSTWGGHGRSEGNFGDEWFDLTPPSGDPYQPRPSDLPGLLLVHVGHRNAIGKSRKGTPALLRHRPFVGMSLPEGGPSIRAVVAGTP